MGVKYYINIVFPYKYIYEQRAPAQNIISHLNSLTFFQRFPCTTFVYLTCDTANLNFFSPVTFMKF